MPGMQERSEGANERCYGEGRAVKCKVDGKLLDLGLRVRWLAVCTIYACISSKGDEFEIRVLRNNHSKEIPATANCLVRYLRFAITKSTEISQNSIRQNEDRCKLGEDRFQFHLFSSLQ